MKSKDLLFKKKSMRQRSCLQDSDNMLRVGAGALPSAYVRTHTKTLELAQGRREAATRPRLEVLLSWTRL